MTKPTQNRMVAPFPCLVCEQMTLGLMCGECFREFEERMKTNGRCVSVDTIRARAR